MLFPGVREARDRYLEARTPRVSLARVLGLGLFVGVAVGFAVGVALAPASGRVTRSRIRRRAGEAQDKLRESADELGEAGKELIENAERQIKTSVQEKLRERGIIRPRRDVQESDQKPEDASEGPAEE